MYKVHDLNKGGYKFAMYYSVFEFVNGSGGIWGSHKEEDSASWKD